MADLRQQTSEQETLLAELRTENLILTTDLEIDAQNRQRLESELASLKEQATALRVGLQEAEQDTAVEKSATTSPQHNIRNCSIISDKLKKR